MVLKPSLVGRCGCMKDIIQTLKTDREAADLLMVPPIVVLLTIVALAILGA